MMGARVSNRETDPQSTRFRELGVNFAHLAALSAFAVAQPLFDVLDESADFFAVRGTSRGDIVLFALVVTLGPAAVLITIEALAGLASRRLARVLHLVFVAALTGTVVIQALRRSTDLTATAALIGLSAAAGVLVAVLYRQLRPVRSFLSVLALAPLAFLVNFLLISPVSTLTLSGEQDVALANVEAKAPIPVVLIVFDEFPVSSLLGERGDIDAVRFPNFAALARGSTWFRKTTTVSYATAQAVPAILTGIRTKGQRAPTFDEHPRSIFTLLGGTYRMNVVESATHLCPRAVCKGPQSAGAAGEPLPVPAEEPAPLYSDVGMVYLHLVAPPRLEETLPPITDQWMNFGRDEDEGEELLEQALSEAGKNSPSESETGAPPVKLLDERFQSLHQRQYDQFVESIRVGTGPSLNLMHVFKPHGPWSYFPSGSRSSLGAAPAPGHDSVTDAWREPFLALQAHQRHLLQVGYVDLMLGQLLDRLHRTGMYDDSLVVVTADHGVSFRPGEPKRSATRTNLEDIAFVPLFVKAPAQRRPAVVDYHVETIDILPTIADLLGIRIPWPIDGRTALDDPGRPTVVVHTPPRAAASGEVRASFASLELKHETLIRQKVKMFGAGDWERVFAVGPHRDLLGRSVREFAVVSSGDHATIEHKLTRELLQAIQPDLPFVPSPLQGRVGGSGAVSGRSLAVAVNGSIEAVAETYDRSGTVRFSALLPESAFRPGPNRVVFYWVEDGVGGAQQLGQLASE